VTFLFLKDDDDDDGNNNNKRGRVWKGVEKFCLFSTTGTVLELEYKLSCVSRRFISRAACDVTTAVL
jgi:hypothetical protein